MAAKILLVEDDNNLREIYEARLEAEGYTIVTAKDGEEALVVAKAEKPDLVVSDVMMPRISGFEMLDILRNTAELKDTKVIMLTALGQADDQTRATSLGADRYLVKSQVTLEDIVKAAHDLIEGPAPGPANTGTPDATTPAATPIVPAAPPAPMPPQASPIAPAAPAPTPPMPVHEEPVMQAPVRDVPAVPAPAPPAVPAPVQPPVVSAPAPEMPQPAPQPPVVPPVPAAPTAPNTAPVIPVAEPKTDEPTAPPAPASPVPAPKAKAPESEAKADATPTADEQAVMHTQIEDFINNNLTHPEATGPQAASSPTLRTDSPVDDALLASAVQDLAGSRLPVPSAPEVHAAPTVPVAPPPAAPTPNNPVLAKPAEPRSVTGNNSVTIANKKIIQPIKSEKPGLDELLAREEARERSGPFGTAAAPVLGMPPSPADGMPFMQPPMTLNPPAPGTLPQQPNSGTDPSSIAL